MGKSKDYPDATDYSNPEIRLIGNDVNKLQKNYKLSSVVQSIYDQFTVDLGGQSVTSQDITNWNTAYGWGDWSTQGFATQTWVQSQNVSIFNNDAGYLVAADISDVMHLSGTETATGQKIFSGGISSSNTFKTRFGFGAANSSIDSAYYAMGGYAMYSNIDGQNIMASGNNAGYYNIHGNNWLVYGVNGALHLSDGLTQATDFNDSIYIGNATRVSSNGVLNEIVIGNSAIGEGSNTIKLGNNSIIGVYSSGFFYSSNTTANKIPSGTILQRPSAPLNGMIRYNADNNYFEGYQSGAWVEFSTGGGTGAEYAPTFSTLTNISSIQSFTAEYIKTGKVIKVHLSVYAIVSAAGLCKYTITLPTADIPKYWDDPVGSVTVIEAADTAWALGSITMISNTQATVSWIATSTGVGGSTMSVDFMYVIN